jgi:hypothetical protein
MAYTPRRANLKRWLEGAPDCILDVFDNKGKTADRYTVMFTGPDFLVRSGGTAYKDTWVPHLDMSDAPSHPQGVSMWGEMPAYDTARLRYVWGKQRIRWLDLPEHIRKHVVARVTT